MDRIEDEAVRYLFFLQVVEDTRGPGSQAGDDGEEYEPEPVGVSPQQKAAAQTTLEDFTRNIQRKKDKEMAELQMVGGEATAGPQTVRSQKVGRNDPCPCGSGKKYKKCHGS